MNRYAKIIATIGPSSQDETVLRNMIKAGMDVARLNFSHGTHEDHHNRIQLIRKLSKELDKPITILQDLQGPKLRVGTLPPEGILLKPDQTAILTPLENIGKLDLPVKDVPVIPFDVPDLIESAKIGNRILLDDGNLEFQVVDIQPAYMTIKVVLGGKLLSHKGVNLPGAPINIPGFTEKDKEDLLFGLKEGIDAVAISFVRSAKDIEIVRNTINNYNPELSNLPIIAKLERPEAMSKLAEIISLADGVMVARGDLAVETSPASVPIMQKQIIQMANLYSKTVITATQMLDSMIHNPRPTRAEASDVANAIFDGTDAVMLSGETASGEYPVESIKMMDAIIREAEPQFQEWGRCQESLDGPSLDDAISITRAARELAHDHEVCAIAVFSLSGKTALFMSKTRPRVPIMVFTPFLTTYRRLGLCWGVIPFLVPFAATVEEMISTVEKTLMSNSMIKQGEQVVLVSGFPVGNICPPSIIILHTIKHSC